MLAFFVLIAGALGTWWLLTPTLRFHRGFASLIDSPQSRFGRTGRLRFGSWVTGRFQNRAVTLRIERPAENVFGNVTLAMDVRAPDGAPWKDSAMTSNDPELSRATFDLEGRYGLLLTLSGGSLRASFNSPPGVLFPGPFDEEQWRNTLRQMHVVAEWLERPQVARSTT